MNAEIICRKEPYGVICEWRGNERAEATVWGREVDEQIPKGESPMGKIIRIGGLKLRVVDHEFAFGAYWDSYRVMLAHNPHSDLQVLYRSAVRYILRFSVNLEARVRGFMLQPTEGKIMPLTAGLAKRLL